MNLLGTTMGTTERGTPPDGVLKGLKKYLDDHGVKFKRISAQGWRHVPGFVVDDGPRVSMDWIKEGTLGKSFTWLLVGWYKYDRKSDAYRIYDGHWMTVVGYGRNRTKKLDPNVLVVHDPAERAERKNYFPSLSVLEHGVLIDNGSPEPVRSAKGALSLGGDVVLKPGADFGIIQGAYRLEFDATDPAK